MVPETESYEESDPTANRKCLYVTERQSIYIYIYAAGILVGADANTSREDLNVQVNGSIVYVREPEVYIVISA